MIPPIAVLWTRRSEGQKTVLRLRCLSLAEIVVLGPVSTSPKEGDRDDPCVRE